MGGMRGVGEGGGVRAQPCGSDKVTLGLDEGSRQPHVLVLVQEPQSAHETQRHLGARVRRGCEFANATKRPAVVQQTWINKSLQCFSASSEVETALVVHY